MLLGHSAEVCDGYAREDEKPQLCGQEVEGATWAYCGRMDKPLGCSQVSFVLASLEFMDWDSGCHISPVRLDFAGNPPPPPSSHSILRVQEGKECSELQAGLGSAKVQRCGSR